MGKNQPWYCCSWNPLTLPAGRKSSSSRYDTQRRRLEISTSVSPHMHTHAHIMILSEIPQSFLFFMVGVWPVSESHRARRFLIRGAWDRDAASPRLHLSVPADERGFHRERKRGEYFRGRRCIFLTRGPSPLWHDWQNGRGERRCASEAGCKWEEADSVRSRAHT